MNTDPIADMLTRIRNANMVSLTDVEMPGSKLKIELALHLSSNEREAIRNNAYQTVKKYDIGKISHILTDIFQSIK